MKTPEEMAEEWGNVQPLISFDDQDREQLQKAYECSRKNYAKSFLAGYQAAKDETNLPTPAKWISVKEKLPNYNEEVLFHRAKYKDLFVGYRAELDAYVDPEGNGLTDDLIFKYYNFWMPLPEPPKDRE